MNVERIHQYVDRATGSVCTERFVGDRIIEFLYSPVREYAPAVFKALTSSCLTHWLAFFAFNMQSIGITRTRKLARALNIREDEMLDPETALRSPRNLFERQIRYWECRPMPVDQETVVSPADARCVIGSFDDHSHLFLKEKFFSAQELLGERGTPWLRYFEHGDYAVFRLTPDKYHYNHCPVSGVVVDFYEVEGDCHSCHPLAVTLVRPYAKNRRAITIFDTDVTDGTRVGWVAMIEVVALMVGGIAQCYSERYYEQPHPLEIFEFARKGQPKSLFYPGSSIVVLLFEKGRVRWDEDLVFNSLRKDVRSRFSFDLTRPVVETDVQVRSSIGRRVPMESAKDHTRDNYTEQNAVFLV